MKTYRLGIDVGGTFTDFILYDSEGKLDIFKVPSTEDGLGGIKAGMDVLTQELGLGSEEFLGKCRFLIHGTTIATNMMLQRRGPKIGLITTRGHRDILYLRNGYKPERYNLLLPRVEPLVPRGLRLPVEERVDYCGRVVTPLNEADVMAAIVKFKAEDVRTISVCLLWSFMNPEHEDRVCELVKQEMPGVHVLPSHQVLPVMDELQRFSSTTLSSYIYPGADEYMKKLKNYFWEHGFNQELLIIQNNAGAATIPEILEKPVSVLMSGPAAGPTATQLYAKMLSVPNIMMIDMGGTSFETSLVTNYQPAVTMDAEIESMPFGLPCVEVRSIGAGGGSIAYVDAGGALHVGPGSAQAVPGPACYGRGGTEPTVTDANLVLGYLNKDYFLGGKMEIYPEKAEKAVDTIAEKTGMDRDRSAYAIYRVINNNMVSAMRVVSTGKGIDPRDYVLLCAGGAGAIHAGKIAEEIGIEKVIIPKNASGFCALGMVCSDISHDYLKTYAALSTNMNIEDINSLFNVMEEDATQRLLKEGVNADSIVFERHVQSRYLGQHHDIMIPVPGEKALEQSDVKTIADVFHAEHERLYAFSRPEIPVEFLHWGVTAKGLIPKPVISEQQYAVEDAASAFKGTRRVYSDKAGGFAEGNIYDGLKLRYGMCVEGMAVIELPTTTIVVFENQTVTVNKYGDFELTVPGAQQN